MQSETPADADRRHIIDAAYDCLSEPHTGPIPIAVILARAGVSTRAFYRQFASKDELFLAMLRTESDDLTERLNRILSEHPGSPVERLRAWIEQLYALVHDPHLRKHMLVLDSEEVRSAKGYREIRDRSHADRERSLMEILERGRRDGSMPLADPDCDAIAINAVVARQLTMQPGPGPMEFREGVDCALDFALRAVGAERPTDTSR